MQLTRDDFLAGAGFSLNEYGSVGPSDFTDQRLDFTDGQTISEKDAGGLRLQVFRTIFRRVLLQGVMNGVGQTLSRNRLAEDVRCTHLDRVHDIFMGRGGGQQDYR